MNSEKLENARKGDQVVIGGKTGFLLGTAILDPQEKPTSGTGGWGNRFGSEKTMFFWTGDQMIGFLPSFEGDNRNDWMAFDQVETDPETTSILAAAAKQFGQSGQPRWKVEAEIMGKEWYVADIATVNGQTPEDNEGMMCGQIVARYVLLETRDGERMLFVMGQKVPMSGKVNPTLLTNGKVIDIEDDVEVQNESN